MSRLAPLLLLLGVQSAFSFKVGEIVCFSAGLTLRNGACGSALGTANGNERGTVLSISNTMTCSLGTYTWLQMQLLDYGPTYWGAIETGLIYDCGNGGGTEWNNGATVPYVNQRWDTGDSFDGSWACGPTSAVMVVAALGKLSPKALTTSSPWVHNNNYGYYDFSIYTSPTGYVFNAMQPDASGQKAYGAYGSCTSGGEAWAYLMQAYVENHGGISTSFYSSTSFSLLQNAINAKHLVLQSTEINGYGHLVVVRGYTSDGKVIVNDPWGDANLPNWGIYPNGQDVVYTMTKLAPKWCIVVSTVAANETLVLGPRAPKDVRIPQRPPPFWNEKIMTKQ